MSFYRAVNHHYEYYRIKVIFGVFSLNGKYHN